jgi:hypothetical protein
MTQRDRCNVRATSIRFNRIVGYIYATIETRSMTPAHMHSLAINNPFLVTLSVHVNDHWRGVLRRVPRFTDAMQTLRHVILESTPVHHCRIPRVPTTLCWDWAPRIRVLDIQRLNGADARVMHSLIPHLATEENAELRCQWQHLQWLGERFGWDHTRQLFDRINTIRVIHCPTTGISNASLVFLYAWATCKHTNRSLWWTIQSYTAAVHRELETAFHDVGGINGYDRTKTGLSEFHLVVHNVDEQIPTDIIIDHTLALFVGCNTCMFLDVAADTDGALETSAQFVYGLLFLLSFKLVCTTMTTRLSLASNSTLSDHGRVFCLLDDLVTQHILTLMHVVDFHSGFQQRLLPMEYVACGSPVTLHVHLDLRSPQQYTLGAHGAGPNAFVTEIRNELVARGHICISPHIAMDNKGHACDPDKGF